MPNMSTWMSNADKAHSWLSDIEDDYRDVHFTHRAIIDKPCSIIVTRVDGTTLPAQTVRIEQTRIQPDRDVAKGGREHVANATLLGYKNHPTIADTDLRSGDRFMVDGIRYEVRMIFPDTPGRIEAWLEVME